MRTLAAALLLLLAGCGDVPAAASDEATIRIEAGKKVCWSGAIGDATQEGCGPKTFENVEGVGGIYSANVQKQDDNRKPVTIILEVGGEEVDRTTVKAPYGVAQVIND